MSTDPDHDPMDRPLAPFLADYIKSLQELLAAHGNLPVERWSVAKGRHGALEPRLAWRRNYSRNKADAFWHPTDTEAQRGDPVIRI